MNIIIVNIQKNIKNIITSRNEGKFFKFKRKALEFLETVEDRRNRERNLIAKTPRLEYP